MLARTRRRFHARPHRLQSEIFRYGKRRGPDPVRPHRLSRTRWAPARSDSLRGAAPPLRRALRRRRQFTRQPEPGAATIPVNKPAGLDLICRNPVRGSRPWFASEPKTWFELAAASDLNLERFHDRFMQRPGAISRGNDGSPEFHATARRRARRAAGLRISRPAPGPRSF
jgi:hypothetical protein